MKKQDWSTPSDNSSNPSNLVANYTELKIGCTYLKI